MLMYKIQNLPNVNMYTGTSKWHGAMSLTKALISSASVLIFSYESYIPSILVVIYTQVIRNFNICPCE